MASQVVLNLIQTYRYHSFANYGGVPAKAEYCHEAVGSSFVFGSFNFIPVQALRLVLHTISTSAGRYGRYIQPLLSLSIDFYVRVFVRVQVAPIEVKKALAYVLSFYFLVLSTDLRIERCPHSIYALDVKLITSNQWEGWLKRSTSLPGISMSCSKLNLARQYHKSVQNATALSM